SGRARPPSSSRAARGPTRCLGPPAPRRTAEKRSAATPTATSLTGRSCSSGSKCNYTTSPPSKSTTTWSTPSRRAQAGRQR
ncbi:unnamed protein product, partial [Ectocarpus sp. 12 AP-2014]